MRTNPRQPTGNFLLVTTYQSPSERVHSPEHEREIATARLRGHVLGDPPSLPVRSRWRALSSLKSTPFKISTLSQLTFIRLHRVVFGVLTIPSGKAHDEDSISIVVRGDGKPCRQQLQLVSCLLDVAGYVFGKCGKHLGGGREFSAPINDSGL